MSELDHLHIGEMLNCGYVEHIFHLKFQQDIGFYCINSQLANQNMIFCHVLTFFIGVIMNQHIFQTLQKGK